MIAAGILQGRQVELLAGEIVEMSPETPLHYSTAKRGAKYLEALLTGKAEVRFNGPITLAQSEPEPDIALVRLPDSLYVERHPGPQDVFWLVEFTKTSLKKNLEVKAAIYAAAEIREYWVLDLALKRLIQFREPQQGQYCQETVLSAGAVAPLAFPEVQVAVERLFL